MKDSRNNTNIVLIGMPGSGKSTCGVLIAKTLCKSFLDTDLLIQNREGCSLQDILNSKGVDYFSKAESCILQELDTENTVISTGGSAVYYEEAMNHLKENGIVVYLHISLEVMLSRIRNITTRGILLHPGETVQQMFAARETLYEKYADIVIDSGDLSVEQTVEAACKAVAREEMQGSKKM